MMISLPLNYLIIGCASDTMKGIKFRLSRKARRPELAPGPSYLPQSLRGSVVHSARRHCRRRGLLLRHFRHHRFGGDQEPGDRGSVLQGAAHHLGGIDDALGHEVTVLAVLSVEAEIILLLVEDLADHDGAVLTRIDGDLPRRP